MERSYGVVVYNLINNKILVYKNKQNKLLFYKGKQEKNEQKEDTAIREFYEETGFITEKIYLEKYFETRTKNKLIGIFLLNWINIKNKNNNPHIVEDIETFLWLDLKKSNHKLFTKNQQQLYLKIYNELQNPKYKILKQFIINC